MANLKDKLKAEMENISIVLRELEKVKDKPNKSIVELAGLATFLHNIYTGIENILKQILVNKGVCLQLSDSWHRDLLILAVKNGVVSKNMKKQLAKYLAFRHFFVHAYGFLLEEKELKLLVDNISNVYSSFKKEIKTFL